MWSRMAEAMTRGKESDTHRPTNIPVRRGARGAPAGHPCRGCNGLGACGTAREAAELEDLTPMRRRRAAVPRRAHGGEVGQGSDGQRWGLDLDRRRVNIARPAPPVGGAGRPPACVPAAKPGRLSSSVSRSIATARRVSRFLARLDELQAAPMPRVPEGRARPGSSNRTQNFSIPGPGRAAHGAEARFRCAGAMSGSPWAAIQRSGIRPTQEIAPNPLTHDFAVARLRLDV